MKRILDASFRYRPSFETDLRKTFAEYRRKQRARRIPAPGADGNVMTLPVLRRTAESKK